MDQGKGSNPNYKIDATWEAVAASGKVDAAEVWIMCRGSKEDELTWQALKMIEEAKVRVLDEADLDGLILQEALLRLPFSPPSWKQRREI